MWSINFKFFWYKKTEAQSENIVEIDLLNLLKYLLYVSEHTIKVSPFNRDAILIESTNPVHPAFKSNKFKVLFKFKIEEKITALPGNA